MRRFLIPLLLCLISLPSLAATDAELIAAGRAAFERRDYAKASGLFEKAIAANSKNADAHYWHGASVGREAQDASLLRQAGLAKKARTSLERAVELDPNHIDARMALVDFYSIAPGIVGGSMEKALAQAAEIKKRDALQGHRAAARVYLRQKKTDLARKELVDAVREQPTLARAHQVLGTFLLNTDKNYSGALHEFEMALKLDPDYMPAQFRIGQYAAQAGREYARGETALRKYLAYKPKDEEPTLAAAWYWLGMLYEKQGRKAEAKQAFANALKLAPQDTAVREAVKRVS